MKRYQESNKITKLWRRRWYLLIPFKFIYSYVRYFFAESEYKLSAKQKWSIFTGEAQYKMKWYYTTEEVFDRIKIK